MWSRSLVVGILASILDMVVMFALTSASVGDQAAFVIATSIGLVIQFIGNHVWSFSLNTNTKRTLKNAILFLSFELIVMIALSFIFPYIILFIEKEIPNALFIASNGHVTPVGSVVLKHIIAFFTFNLVSYPVWKYLIFKERKPKSN